MNVNQALGKLHRSMPIDAVFAVTRVATVTRVSDGRREWFRGFKVFAGYTDARGHPFAKTVEGVGLEVSVNEVLAGWDAWLVETNQISRVGSRQRGVDKGLRTTNRP